MAKKATISFIDDLDGKTAADETVTFGIDGVIYKIDLAAKNAKKLRDAFQVWIGAGRRTGGRRGRGSVGPSRGGADHIQNAAIREWARRRGYQLGQRGTIPGDVIDAFRSAH